MGSHHKGHVRTGPPPGTSDWISRIEPGRRTSPRRFVEGRQSAGGGVDSSLESQDAPLRSRATRRHSQKDAIICCQ
jgi:hypothetical protein